MLNKNTEIQNNKRKRLENNKSSNYYRCCSVDVKNNNPSFSKDLEKEYLDIKHLVRNSVEKINILFNNEEFNAKQRTSKKSIQTNFNKININKFNFNKPDSSFEQFKKEEEKTNNIYKDNNFNKTDQNLKKINISFFGNGEEYKYNSNDLLEELKDLNSNRIINEKKVAKFFQQKKSNNTETDNKALLNLESNKLYRNKEPINKIKKLNITNNIKNDKNQKEGYIANYLKTAKHQNIVHYKDKKIEPMKFIQKNNNNKKIIQKVERNNNILNSRLTNNSTLNHYKNIERKKVDKELLTKYNNATFRKENSYCKKINNNNSTSSDIDINLNFNKNDSTSKLNINSQYEEKTNKIDKEKIFLSINKHLYKGEKRDVYLHKILNDFNNQNKKVDNSKKRKSNHIKANTDDVELPSLKNDSPSKFINIDYPNKKFEKISTQNFLKMMLMLNQYLINNNLIDDYSKPDNKKILDEFSNFLNKNIKKENNNQRNKGRKENDCDKNISGLKTERIIKKDNNLNENINSDVKNNQTNYSKNKCASKNLKLDSLFNNIINKYNLISENNN